MEVRNTALEKLGYKVIEEEIITASAKSAGDEAATWAAKCAEQNPKFLSRSVSVALQAPPASKIQQQSSENQQLELEERVRAAAVINSSKSEERNKKVANVNKQWV